MKAIKINPETMELRFSNPLMQFADMVKPQKLYMIAGRGTTKTTFLMAKRTLDCIDQMPRGLFSFIGESFVKAQEDIIPKVLGAWDDRFGMRYGIDYVHDEKPPDTWPKPIDLRIKEYKKTLSTKEGCRFIIKSLDRPTSLLGVDSYHMFGDEVKTFDKDKIKKAFPTLRGDSVRFKDAPLFMGVTFTTDMPNAADGEYDWILDMGKNTNIKQILDCYYIADVINDLNKNLVSAIEKEDKFKQDKLKRHIIEWSARFNKRCKGSSLLLISSSFSNIDILTLDYLINQFETLDYDEYKSAILSIKTFLAIGERFYGKFTNKNIYEDGYKHEYFDARGLRENMSYTSAGLKYWNGAKHLEGGFDAGNMNSLVIAQESGNVFRCLKNFYTLTPEWIDDLGEKFRNYFAPQSQKLLYLRYDRAANNYRKAGQDYASQLKKAIEWTKDGKPSGWTVILKSIGQGNIAQSLEHKLANAMFNGDHPDLPMLMIDNFECKELISSIRLAPAKKKPGTKEILKEKKSEKLPVHRLPMESTNMSDAFKYLICTEKHIYTIKNWKPLSNKTT